MDPQLKQLMKELGDVINESLAESKLIAEVVSRIRRRLRYFCWPLKPPLA
jgi:hypothetical protein